MAANIDKALAHKVKSDAGVASLIGVRFFPVRVPQGQPMPMAIYQATPGKVTKEHGNPIALPNPRYQITCWAQTFEEVVDIDAAIKKAIDGKREDWGTGLYVTSIQRCQAEVNPRDDSDAVTGLFWRSRDYFIMYKT